ncbi:hypothetical protein COLO4_24999 [Corchorus olitorius]|uniref:Nucleic acid-binding protein n=1 Tax=Corchorus olitorius TaxID=93759 RepID=A0A1R3I5F1_9ROSI|nr:hypothetical protein COLO4_24999 [Corchorus olitorius]
MERTQLIILVRDQTACIILTAFGPLAKSLLGLEGAGTIVFTEVDKFKLHPTAKDIKGKDYVFTVGVPDQTLKWDYLSSSINPPAAHNVISLTPQKAVHCFGDVVPDNFPGTPYISHVLPPNKASEQIEQLPEEAPTSKRAKPMARQLDL